jgi:hypothetical protein
LPEAATKSKLQDVPSRTLGSDASEAHTERESTENPSELSESQQTNRSGPNHKLNPSLKIIGGHTSQAKN